MPALKPFLRTIPLLSSLIFLNSCATLFNGAAQKVWISTGKNITGLRVEMSIPVDSSSLDGSTIGSYLVPRSARGLIVHFRLGSVEKTLILRPRNSFAFWYNIPGTYGIGILIDRSNPKRYAYPSWTYLSATDTIVHRHWFPPVSKGRLRLSLAYSPLNHFNLASPEGQFNTFGINGLEAGLDYFYKTDRYASLSLGAATSALPVDYIGPGYVRTANAFYANIRNNYVVGSFDLGYGINMSKLVWIRTTIDNAVNLNRTTQSVGFGLSLAAQYRIGNHFRIGLLYQPDLLNANHSPELNYQHYFSISFAWKIALR